MRKNIKKFAGIVLCIGMFTGCAQTPDSSLVKPKGSKAVDAYTEADDVSGSKGEASESKNDDGSDSKITIRNLIDAPQNYKSHVEDDSAKLVVNTDASVEIPEVEKISAISVTAAEVTQELLDRITNAFFSEAKLYTMDSYYVKTKDEIKKTLDELKEDVANGNLDFEKRGFRLVGIFDVNPVLEGIAVRGLEIQMLSELPFFLRENNVEIAILTLPKNKAKEMADILVENGIKAIWNFAHLDLETPDDVIVENVHLSESLMTLSYNLSKYRQEHVDK